MSSLFYHTAFLVTNAIPFPHKSSVLGRIHTEASSNKRHAIYVAYRNRIHTETIAISLSKSSFSGRQKVLKEICLLYRRAIHIGYRYKGTIFVVDYRRIEYVILCAAHHSGHQEDY
jgi:hypothetical protein